MLIDNIYQYYCSLLYLWFNVKVVLYTNRATDSDVKKIVLKHLKDAPKRKGGEGNQSFKDWTHAANVEKNLNLHLHQRIKTF